jgi:hypothetical protein
MALKDKIRARKQQEYRQNRQIINQLNQLKGAGYSDEDIRGAGNNAYNVLMNGAPAPQVTVKDGDTIETLAETTGTSPVDILAANPELRQVRTGMVINTPQTNTPGSPAWRDQNIYSGGPGSVQSNPELKYTQGGLPSNAALGGMTTNPGGLSSTTSGSAGTVNYQQNFLNTERSGYGVPLTNATANQPRSLFGSTGGLGRGTTTTPRTTPALRQPNLAPNQESYLLRNPEIRTVLNKIYGEVDDRFNPNSRLPTDAELKQLEAHGWIKRDTSQTPTPAYAGGGGGYGRRKGRGGGGGGGGSRISSGGGTRSAGGNGGVPRAPAFSSGASFRGLVNWRI